MTILDKEIQAALSKFEETFPEFFANADPEQYEVGLTYHGYLIGWLLSKGFPTDSIIVVECVNKYKEDK